MTRVLNDRLVLASLLLAAIVVGHGITVALPYGASDAATFAAQLVTIAPLTVVGAHVLLGFGWSRRADADVRAWCALYVIVIALGALEAAAFGNGGIVDFNYTAYADTSAAGRQALAVVVAIFGAMFAVGTAVWHGRTARVFRVVGLIGSQAAIAGVPLAGFTTVAMLLGLLPCVLLFEKGNRQPSQ